MAGWSIDQFLCVEPHPSQLAGEGSQAKNAQGLGAGFTGGWVCS